MSESQHREVVIVGTSHTLQLGAAGDSLAEEFSEMLNAVCGRVPIHAVAEEMSAEALAENGVEHSLGMRLAKERKLPHRLCDPGPALRSTLGMSQENDVRASAWLKRLSQTETDNLVQAEHSKRERYWLDQLQELAVWPVLFICGANHVSSFTEMLSDANIDVSIAVHDWPLE